jgi:hypothetical protein
MTDDSVSRYFEIYRVNLNGEKKPENILLKTELTIDIKQKHNASILSNLHNDGH